MGPNSNTKAARGLGFKDCIHVILLAYLYSSSTCSSTTSPKYSQGTALLARWASKVLIDVLSKWKQMFLANLTSFNWENPRLLRRHNYSLMDKMLFSKPKTFGYYTYTKGLWLAWASLRNFLFYFLLGALIPSHWTIQHLLFTILSVRKLPLQKQQQISAIFVCFGITTVVNLWDPVRSRWRSFTHRLNRIRELSPTLHAIVTTLLLISQADDILHAPNNTFSHCNWLPIGTRHKAPGNLGTSTPYLLATI